MAKNIKTGGIFMRDLDNDQLAYELIEDLSDSIANLESMLRQVKFL
jgi:hypothetical protein